MNLLDDLPEDFKTSLLNLLPEGTKLLEVVTDHARGYYVTISNNNQETVIRISHIELMDRLHSCDGLVFEETNTSKLIDIYNEIIEDVCCHDCIKPAFGIELKRDYEQEHVAGYPELPHSGEILNVVTYITETDNRNDTGAIITKEVIERLVNSGCGCCALKTRLKLAGTVFSIDDINNVIIDNSLNPVIADKIKHCLDKETLNKGTKASCFTCAEVLGIKEDAISSYFELDVPNVGVVRLRVLESKEETIH